MQFEESKHPRGKDGRFSNKDKSDYSSEVNERIRWAKDNGIELPLNADGSLDDLRLQRLYETKKTVPVKVNMDAEIQKQFDAATPKERQKIAFRYIMDNLRGKYPTNDGRTIAIERVGADKMTHSFDERKIRVLPELKLLIEAGRFRGVIDVKHKLFIQIAYYDFEFAIRDIKYKARLNIGIRKNGDSTLYDIKPIESAKK